MAISDENARIAINRLTGLALTLERDTERWAELGELDDETRAQVIARLPDALREAAAKVATDRGMR